MLVRLRRLQNIYPKALQNTQYLIPHILVRLTYSNPEQFRLDTREKYLTHHQQPFRLVQAYISAKLLWCHNSALNDIALSDQIFFEKWINGSTRYEVIVNFDDVEYDQLNRIPILVGGNIGNTPFLYMYIADLPSLPQNASALTGTAIIETPLSFYVAANKDGGASRRLRIVFANQSANGAHVYIEIKARGGKVQGETASQIS